MWNIVTDSSCDDIRFEEQREDILYQSVPFYLYTDNHEYVDDGNIVIPEMMEDLQKSKTARTSCPSPASFAEAFRKPGDVIAFTISSELSGSFRVPRLPASWSRKKSPESASPSLIRERTDLRLCS